MCITPERFPYLVHARSYGVASGGSPTRRWSTVADDLEAGPPCRRSPSQGPSQATSSFRSYRSVSLSPLWLGPKACGLRCGFSGVDPALAMSSGFPTFFEKDGEMQDALPEASVGLDDTTVPEALALVVKESIPSKEPLTSTHPTLHSHEQTPLFELDDAYPPVRLIRIALLKWPLAARLSTELSHYIKFKINPRTECEMIISAFTSAICSSTLPQAHHEYKSDSSCPQTSCSVRFLPYLSLVGLLNAAGHPGFS
jgi:hypothetical protein